MTFIYHEIIYHERKRRDFRSTAWQSHLHAVVQRIDSRAHVAAILFQRYPGLMFLKALLD